jgi:hypothetical protein
VAFAGQGGFIDVRSGYFEAQPCRSSSRADSVVDASTSAGTPSDRRGLARPAAIAAQAGARAFKGAPDRVQLRKVGGSGVVLQPQALAQDFLHGAAHRVFVVPGHRFEFFAARAGASSTSAASSTRGSRAGARERWRIARPATRRRRRWRPAGGQGEVHAAVCASAGRRANPPPGGHRIVASH